MASYADVVRGTDETAPLPEKRVSISLNFTGGEAQWRNLFESLEVAKRWSKFCGHMIGNNVLKREDSDFLMEVKIDSLAEEPTAVEQSQRAICVGEEPRRIDGLLRLEGQRTLFHS